MSRALVILDADADRNKAARWVMQAPKGTRVEFKKPRRSTEQNDRMWAMLTEIAEQVSWHGVKYTPEDWKDYFMHALKRARWMPLEDGGMVPIGMRSSDLSKEEFSDLMECMSEFGARHGVKSKEPEAA